MKRSIQIFIVFIVTLPVFSNVKCRLLHKSNYANCLIGGKRFNMVSVSVDATVKKVELKDRTLRSIDTPLRDLLNNKNIKYIYLENDAIIYKSNKVLNGCFYDGVTRKVNVEGCGQICYSQAKCNINGAVFREKLACRTINGICPDYSICKNDKSLSTKEISNKPNIINYENNPSNRTISR